MARYSSVAARQLEDFLLVSGCFFRTRRLVEKVEIDVVIIGHSSHCLVRVIEALGIIADANGRQAETCQRRESEPRLADEICSQTNPKEQDIFLRQPRPPT